MFTPMIQHGLKQSPGLTAVFAVLLLLLSAISAFPLTLQKQPVPETPYDPYLGPFRQVAAAPPGHREFTMDAMEKWTRRAYRFGYEHTGDYEWKTPEEVERTSTGDCKDKALWLYSKLKAAGAAVIELVIGKRHLADADLHAWVVASHQGRTYLLDPASRSSAWEVSEFEWDEYIPVFSYHENQAFSYKIQTPVRRERPSVQPAEFLRRDFEIVPGACPSTLCPL